ncbi:alpha/beta hydrolase family protein [Simkania sp.]|uniref:alpha/beta hydrolase family protein n=1 Tax=Simkania sp. TaxID=34094 RepID=UPI003B523456
MRNLLMIFLCLGLTKGYGIEDNIFLLELPDRIGEKVEVYMESPQAGSDQLLIFFHGAAVDKGLRGLSTDWCNHWLKKGYAVASISLPGYGDTSGQKDFCGPHTMLVVNEAVNHIKETLGVKDFGVIGFGQGGLAGALLSSMRDDVRLVVCTNGGYDFFRHMFPGDPLLAILREKNYEIDIQDLDAIEARSLYSQVNKLKAPLFLLHRKGHSTISVEEVTDFAHAMNEAGKECHLVLCEESEDQKISYEETLSATEAWVDAHMRLNCSIRFP